ncbi:MAG: phage tail sheath subtilisin-like domain-containing protein [Pseudomonadota bacterium]
MAISFNEVPQTRTPFLYAEITSDGAVKNLGQQTYQALLIGQVATGSTVATGELVNVVDPEAAATMFGDRSQLAGMVKSYAANDSNTALWALPLAEATGATAASGSIAVSGSGQGTINLYIAGERIRVAVTSNERASAVATRLAKAITEHSSVLVTAEVDERTNTQINLTAVTKGESGNEIDLRLSYYDGESLPTGLTLTLNALTGGGGNPDLTKAWEGLGDEHFNIIVLPYTDASNLRAVDEELSDRWGPVRMIEGTAFAATSKAIADAVKFGKTQNSKHISILASVGSPTPPWCWAAAAAARVARHGNIDPARPFQTLPLRTILPPPRQSRLTMRQSDQLLRSGISTAMIDSGGVVRIQRLITTYQTNPAGAEDVAFLDVNTILTLAYIRWDFRTFITNKYPRHKLADDGTRFGAGQKIVTPKIAKGDAVGRFRQWETSGLVEGGDQFKKDLIVERNPNDHNRLDFRLSPNIVNQLRICGVQIAFIL